MTSQCQREVVVPARQSGDFSGLNLISLTYELNFVR